MAQKKLQKNIGPKNYIFKYPTTKILFVIKKKRNNMSIIFSQYFYNKFYVVGCYLLLLLEEKNNLSVRFKFEPTTTNHL